MDLGPGELERLRAEAFRASPLSFFVLDPSGLVVVANDAAARLLGRPASEIVGARLEDFADDAHRNGLFALVSSAFRGERPPRQEVRFLRADGSARYGGFTVVPLDDRVVAIVRDITEEYCFRESLLEAERQSKTRLAQEIEQRQRAEGTRERIEDTLHLLIDMVPDLAIVHRGGRIVHVNDVTLRSLGYAAAGDLLGRPMLDLVHPDDRAEVRERTQVAMQTGAVAPPRMSRALHHDGSYREVEWVSLPILFGGDAATLSLGRDIGERRKLESQLALGERLVAMGTLAAGIGHEINNPLTYLMSNLELLRDEVEKLPSGGDAREARAMLRECLDGAERIRKIVPGLKGLSRMRPEARTRVELCDVLEPAIAMTANEVRHRARLVRHYGECPPVDAEQARLTQVFVNLLVNAAQAIPEGYVDENEIRVTTSTDEAGRAQVDVADTGCGVAPENLERIFEPFFTSKPVGEGTGLGLSISHGIVRELGGTLTVQSAGGRGSVFRVVLPPSAASSVNEAPRRAPAPARRRGRVLAIDDEPAIGAVVRRILGAEHDVTVVHSGREALELLCGGERFDVVFCDLMMPDISGMDVHGKLALVAPQTAARMVFVTGGAFTTAARTFLAGVGNERIEKPFDIEGLRTLVRRLVSAEPS